MKKIGLIVTLLFALLLFNCCARKNSDSDLPSTNNGTGGNIADDSTEKGLVYVFTDGSGMNEADSLVSSLYEKGYTAMTVTDYTKENEFEIIIGNNENKKRKSGILFLYSRRRQSGLLFYCRNRFERYCVWIYISYRHHTTSTDVDLGISSIQMGLSM